MQEPPVDGQGDSLRPRINVVSSLDLLSDASLLCEEGDFPLPNTCKQVRFDLDSNTTLSSRKKESVPDSVPRRAFSEVMRIFPESLSQPPLQPITPSSSLDLSVVDEPQLNGGFEALSLTTPQINTVKGLQEEVIQLAESVHKASISGPDAKIKQMALEHLTDPFRSQSIPTANERQDKNRQNTTNRIPRPSVSNIPVCVNYNLSDRVYVDLLEISVSESEIVKEEKAKIARRRKLLLAEMLKKPPKPEILPEPCPMKFFDPRKHVFQSARLQTTGLPNLVPTRRGLSVDQLSSVRSDYLNSFPACHV
uniref:PPP1R35_C domain-containing protein n=1 Tax=Mesocestoides corti TaxID=53468 RepID=A0A5K3FYW1_MESCO